MESCHGQICYKVGENWTSAGGPVCKTLLSNFQGMLAISELALYQVALFTPANWYGIVFKRLEYMNNSKN